MREILDRFSWERKALVFFGGVVILVVIGPFATYEDLKLTDRIVYWVAIMTGIGFFMHFTMLVALHLRWFQDVPPFLRLLPGAIAGALPGAAIVVLVEMVFRPPTTSDSLVMIWGQISVIGYAIGLIEFLDWGRKTKDPSSSDSVRTPFHDRMTPELGTDIISLSMQDHYAEVTTTAGNELILIRLSDAISELGKIDGMQVHRSHWANTAHMQTVFRSNGKNMLRLSDGRSIPVSNTYLADLKIKLETL